jgi:hypothetical protein
VLAGDLLAGRQGGSVASVVIGIALLGGVVHRYPGTPGPGGAARPPRSSATFPEPPSSLSHPLQSARAKEPGIQARS